MTFEQPLFLGVDGGGSKCRALLTDGNGQTLGCGISGAANLMRGVENAQTAILDAYEQARCAAGLSQEATSKIIAGMGIAGANMPHLKQALLNWHHPFSRLHVTNDLEVACLGAHQGGAGGVVIIGTGSCGLVNTNGVSQAIGGHGFLLGDKGSGAWFGLRAVQCALEGLSGIAAQTTLTQEVFQKSAVNNEMELVAKYAYATPGEFAQLAPLVFQLSHEDDVAADLVATGVAYIEKVCLKILQQQPERFSLIGGLSTLIYERFSSQLQAQIQPPLSTPENGAVLFAKQQIADLRQ